MAIYFLPPILNTHKTYSLEEAKKRLEGYCAYQERCHKEVRQKLFDLKVYYDEQDEVINHLLLHNFLNETRFAQAFARGKFRAKKWGRNRIVNELKLREISKFNITIALKEITDSDYYKTFEALAEKRVQQLASEKNLQKKCKKFSDYMFYRGWESEMVYAKINDIK